MSAIYIYTKQYDKALNTVDQLSSLAERDNSDEVKALAYQHIGTIYYNHELYKQSFDYFDKSKK